MTSSPQKKETLIPRPPVVAVMGHIDHGKSTLLDSIRKTNHTEKEAGGITQRVSAWEVEHKSEDGTPRRITFLDTPGHEAFRNVRSRGASTADIAILVVSAEDGVKPQTVEAFKFITEAKTPYIVAITKIDKPTANIEKTKQTLAEAGIYLEGYGGDIPFVAVSGKTHEGIKELLDLILLSADLHEINGDPDAPVSALILESHRDQKRGIATTVIVKSGTIKSGMVALSGTALVPLRLIETPEGKTQKQICPGEAGVIIGWDGSPITGSAITIFKNKKEAESAREVLLNTPKVKSDTNAPISAEMVTIPIIIKADLAGSLEAIRHELSKLIVPNARVLIVSEDIGPISETDLKRAQSAENSVIAGFNVKIDRQAEAMLEHNNIQVKTFDIIYKLTEWVAELLSQRRPKTAEEMIRGHVKIIKIFTHDKEKSVVGGKVLDGAINRGDTVLVTRRDVEVGKARLKELQKGKERSESVEGGNECGMLLASTFEIAPGDILTVEIADTAKA